MTIIFTQEEFNKAVSKNGFLAPSGDIYRTLHTYLVNKQFTKEEAAMLIAQLIHESHGFQYKEEQIQFSKHDCKSSAYLDNGKCYHGRGYIMLTTIDNYRAASDALKKGEELVENPEKVAKTTELAVAVSVWYWTAIVRMELRKHANNFWATTKAINDAIDGPEDELAIKRWQIYEKVADALTIRNRATHKAF